MIRRFLFCCFALVLTGCATFQQVGPTVAQAVADSLAPMLPALVSNYRTSGSACIAVARSRAEADGCLVELRTAWRIWDALEPLRQAMDDLAAIERDWQASELARWPEAPSSCALPDAGTGKDAGP